MAENAHLTNSCRAVVFLFVCLVYFEGVAFLIDK